jgi:protein involved in polysaccharide export with SLBB domain
MKKIRTVVVAGGCLLSVLSVVAKEVEEDVEEPKPMIGMAAYEEVLASGNYMVGPQDEFLIYVPGMDEPVIHEVLAEGSLFIPMVGMVKIGGLRLSEAHDKMEEEFRKHVRLGRIDVELSKPRAFPVPVLGLIQIRRTQQGTAVQRVSEMVPVIGELDRAASTRNIRVFNTRTLLAAEAARVESSIRSGDWSILRNLPSKRVDLVLYETTADAKYNPFVEDGDVVVIPPQLGKIGALEAVNRPRIYEFVEGDRISVLLTLAQGPAPNHALGNAVLQRYDEDNTTMYEVEVDLAAVMRGDDAANLPLKPGDQLILRANPEFLERSTIEISGEVNIPGIHVVEKTGTPLKAMIERAGGFTAYATLQEARVTRAILAKEGIGDPEFERILTTPAGDRTEEDNQYFKMRVREKPGQLVVDFAALYKSGDESQNVRLLPGDFVHIPRRQQTVMVSGRAASPGAVIYSPDHGVYDYIEQAGGFGWRATKEVRVIKASTGEIQRAEDVARIDPGDRIWIKEKPERNYWMVFAQSMAVIGQVTTVVLLYVTLTK